MKCCSRSTLGVVIGSLNIVIYVGVSIYSIVSLVHINSIIPRNYQQEEAIRLSKTVLSIILVLCVIMGMISALLIVGIVKRRHNLMMPWLILSGIGFIVHCGNFLFTFIGSLFQGLSVGSILVILIVGVLGIAISALILWPIYTLYGDIRKDNVQKPGRVTVAAPVEYQTQNYYNKSQN